MKSQIKTVLSIAGSDCSGGAGIQADLKTFSAHRVFGMTAVTSVVAENTVRVIEYQDIHPNIIISQIDAIFEDIPPDAIKIGMLSCNDTMLAVSESLKKWNSKNVVIDPVMYAKNGAALMEPASIGTLIKEILPLADILTPNIPEAQEITGISITGLNDMRDAAKAICNMGCKAVVVKGGHMEGDAIDLLFDGKEFCEFTEKRVDTKHTHGTGCTFSAAIASNIAMGLSFKDAVSKAKEYIHAAIVNAPQIGKGHGPTHHFHSLW